MESEVQQNALRVVQTSVGLTIRIGEKTAAWFLRQGGARIRGMRHSVGDSIRQERHLERTSGRMSEKRLQQVSKGDLHVVEFDHDQVRAIVASLKKAGVRYAVERGPVSTWIHFEGKDLDHVTHAVRRALHDVGYELHIDGKNRTQSQEPERESRDKSTPEQDREKSMSPTHDEPDHVQSKQSDDTKREQDDRTSSKSRADEGVRAEQTREPISDDKDLPRTRRIGKAKVLRDLHDRIKEKIEFKPQSPAPTRKRDRTRTR